MSNGGKNYKAEIFSIVNMQPDIPQFTALQSLKTQHDEISKSIRWAILVLLIIGLFCVSLIVESDTKILEGREKVEIPFVGIHLNFVILNILSFIAIISWTVYLHVLIGYWEALSNQLHYTQRLPIFFNLQYAGARISSLVIFYFVTPIIVCGLIYKSLPLSAAKWLIVFGPPFVGWFIWLFVRRVL